MSVQVLALKGPVRLRGDADQQTNATGMFREYVLMELSPGAARFRKQAETFFKMAVPNV